MENLFEQESLLQVEDGCGRGLCSDSCTGTCNDGCVTGCRGGCKHGCMGGCKTFCHNVAF